METSISVLICNFASTWAMVGLIWLIQIVHYPLFAAVGDEQFKAYAEAHQRLITYVVLPLMFCELGTSIWLWSARPNGISSAPILLGIILVFSIWASTFFVQVPLHAKLSSGFDDQIHARLVTSNWIRTIAWTLRGLLVMWMAFRCSTANT